MPECNEFDCNDTLRELELFLDEELSTGARQVIHSHLSGCPDCLQAFDFHAELKTVIAAKCRNDEMPPGLLRKIEMCFGDAAPSQVDQANTATSAVLGKLGP